MWVGIADQTVERATRLTPAPSVGVAAERGSVWLGCGIGHDSVDFPTPKLKKFTV